MGLCMYRNSITWFSLVIGCILFLPFAPPVRSSLLTSAPEIDAYFSPLLAKGKSKRGSSSLKITRYTYANSVLVVTPGRRGIGKELSMRLNQGVRGIYTQYGKPRLKKRPEFWLVSDSTEMRLVLTHRNFRLSEARLKTALQRGAYRDAGRVVLRIQKGVPRDWILRVFFTEYARGLQDALVGSRRLSPIGWLNAGMSAYFSWRAQGELEGWKRERYEKLFFQYYAGHFDPRKPVPLELLERPEDWRKALEERPAAVYAQAALVYLYLARTRGARIGAVILRNYSRERSFSSAFERAVSLNLKDFERELNMKFYPGIKVSRGEKSN